jgi:hypothetical protein
MSNNPPDRVVELTEEQYQFLLEGCNTNIAFGLSALQTLDERGAHKMVTLLEKFKDVKQALERAK